MNEQVSEALTQLRGVIKKCPDDISLRKKLFYSTVQAGLFDEAVKAFTELVQTQPEWSQLHYDTIEHIPSSSRGELWVAFEQAALEQPDDALVWYGLGFFWQLVGGQEEAANAFRRGIAVAPKFAALHYNLGVTLMNDAKKAAEHFQRALACSPTIAEPHFALGTIYMTHDRIKAAHHFREFIRLAPAYSQEYINEARSILQLLGMAGRFALG